MNSEVVAESRIPTTKLKPSQLDRLVKQLPKNVKPGQLIPVNDQSAVRALSMEQGHAVQHQGQRRLFVHKDDRKKGERTFEVKVPETVRKRLPSLLAEPQPV